MATTPEALHAFRDRVYAAAKRQFEWKSVVPLSEWAETHYKIPSSRSSIPGGLSLDLTPYLREMMDAVSDPSINEIIVQKAARLGVTEGMVNAVVGWIVDQQPGPVIVGWPTKEDASEWSKETLSEMFTENPIFDGKISDAGEKDSANTIFHKKFLNGILFTIGSNSSRAVRRKNARYVIVDELDACEDAQSGKEGDFPTRMRRRATTYRSRRKIIFTSQPGERKVKIRRSELEDGAASVDITLTRIEREYQRSDQREYYIPCPHCEHMQTLNVANFEWDKDTVADGIVHRFETAHFKCIRCSGRIEEHHKPKAVRAGTWIARYPGRPIRGYKINAFYSLIGDSLKDLALEWHEAQREQEKMKAFVQQVLGEGYEDRITPPDEKELPARREPYIAEVPMGVGVLTASVDKQHDRVELLVRGWGVGEESWDIAHHRIWGQLKDADVQARMDAILSRAYQHEGGATLHVQCTLVDSGDEPEPVYNYTYPRTRRNIFAVKGIPRKEGNLLIRPGKAGDERTRLFLMDVDRGKDILFRRLRIKSAGAGYIHFPMAQDDGLDDAYLKQFLNEKTFYRRNRAGKSVRIYHADEANEAVDLHNYAYGALRLLGEGVIKQLPQLVTAVQERGRQMGGLEAARKRLAQQPPPEPPAAPMTGRRIRVISKGVQ